MMATTTKSTLWLRWTVAHTLGWVMGGAFSSSALPALFGWSLFGLTQWLVLRTVLPRMGAWVALSAAGGAIGIGLFAATEVLLQRYDPPMVWQALQQSRSEEGRPTSRETSNPVVPDRPPEFWVWPLAGSVLGSVLGAAQWVLLRRRLDGALWWIPANLVAWAVGAGLAGLALMPTFNSAGVAGLTTWSVIAPVAAGGVCAGGISGAALVRIVRRGRRTI